MSEQDDIDDEADFADEVDEAVSEEAFSQQLSAEFFDEELPGDDLNLYAIQM